MANKFSSLCFPFFVLALSCNAQSLTIDFEDALANLGFQGDPASFYESQGLIISGSYFGLLEGVSRGDSGNFNLEGTAGAASLGVNTFGDTIDLQFNRVLGSLCFDVGTAFFAQVPGSPTIRLTTYRNMVQQSSTLITIMDTVMNGNGSWFTRELIGVDRVTLEAVRGSEFWAIDNLQIDNACTDTLVENPPGAFFTIPIEKGNVVIIVL